MRALAFLLIGLTGCSVGADVASDDTQLASECEEDLGTGLDGALCDDWNDCAQSGEACLPRLCVAKQCLTVDLTSSTNVELPRDACSGLPLSKKCAL